MKIDFKLKPTFLIIFVMVFSVKVQAQATVSNYQLFCPQNEFPSKIINQVYILNKEIKCHRVENYLNVIKAINKFNPAKVPSITFSIELNNDDASNISENIKIPYQLTSYDSDGEFQLSQSLSNNYLAHEYGHSIFNKLVGTVFNPLKNSLLQLEKLNQLQYTIFDSIIKNKVELAERLENELIIKEEIVYTDDEILDPIFHILPLSELYSDLVAVLYANDLQAFSKTYIGKNPSQNNIEEASLRDFSENHTLETWDNESRHAYYAPTRTVLGKKIKFPLSDSSKKILLKKFADIMILEVMEKWQREILSPYQNNKDLIQKINLYL
jgi:hypothetical protein